MVTPVDTDGVSESEEPVFLPWRPEWIKDHSFGLRRALGWVNYYLGFPLEPGAKAILQQLRCTLTLEASEGPLTSSTAADPMQSRSEEP